MNRSHDTESRQWRSHPVHAAALRALAFALPLVVSVVVGIGVGALLPAPHSRVTQVLWWAAVLGSSTVAVYAADRVTRKVLPLATLMRLSILFPDRAPSRLKVARKVAGSRAIAAELARAGMASDRQEAAETILALVGALGDYDARTRGHSERTQLFVTMLADELKLSTEDKGKLMWAALVHDIGKLKVPSAVLNKPAKPTEEEWHLLQSHPRHGADICEPLREWLGEWWLAIEQHHEKFDGNGYPHGLVGREISDGARIVAVADSYEVMTAARPYKRPMTAEAARAELTACAGTHFDPEIVRAFLNISLGGTRRSAGPLAWLAQVLMVRPGPLLGQVLGATAGAAGAAATVVALNMAPGISQGEPATTAQERPTTTVVETPAPEDPATEDVAPEPTADAPEPTWVPDAPLWPPLPQTPPPSPESPATPTPSPTPTTPKPSPTPTTPPAIPVPGTVTLADDSATTSEDTPRALDVLTNDVVDGVVHLDALTAPAHGVATIVADQVRYVPDLDWSGTDAFAYTVRGGSGDPHTANVAVEVTAVNDSPVAADDSLVVTEDASGAVLPVLANDTDVDGDALTITAVAGAGNGTAVVGASGLSYTPDPDYSGSETLTYTVSDASGGTTTATASVTVAPVNDAPTAQADTLSMAEDSGTLTLSALVANDSDAENDPLTVAALTGAAHGTLGVSGSAFSYTPDPNFAGSEALTYTLSDGNGGTASGDVLLTVTPVNDAPVATDDVATVAEGAIDVPLDLLTNDTDVEGDALTVTSVAPPSHGTLTQTAGSWSYTPSTDWSGVETLSYTVSDGLGGSVMANVAITTTPVNDAPVAGADALTVAEDSPATALDLLGNDSDIEGDPLTVTQLTGAAHGAVAPSGTDWTYTPAADFHGTETLSYLLDDGNGATDTGAVTITVTPVEDAPVAVDDALSASEDSVDVPLDVLGNDVDVDGDTLTVTTMTGAAHGTLTEQSPGSWIYTPEADWNGVESLGYTLDDGNGGTDTGALALTVTPANDAPVSGPDAHAVTVGQTLATTAVDGVLSNDSDVDGDPLTVVSDDSLLVDISADGSFTYLGVLPGTETISYTVSDGNGGTATTTLTVTVTVLVSPVQDLFLQPVDTTSTGSLSTTPPGNAIGDYDSDGNPGLTIKSSDMKPTENDPQKFQEWSYAVPTGGVTMNGPITMDLWTSLKNQDNHDLDYAAYVYDCATASSCTLLASTANVHVNNWSTTTTWEKRTVTVGSASLTVPAGHTIKVRLAFNHSDVWLPLDSAHPSSLTYR